MADANQHESAELSGTNATFRPSFFRAKEEIDLVWSPAEVSEMTVSLLAILAVLVSLQFKPRYVDVWECRYHLCFCPDPKTDHFYHLYQTADSFCGWAPGSSCNKVHISTEDDSSVDSLRTWLGTLRDLRVTQRASAAEARSRRLAGIVVEEDPVQRYDEEDH